MYRRMLLATPLTALTVLAAQTSVSRPGVTPPVAAPAGPTADLGWEVAESAVGQLNQSADAQSRALSSTATCPAGKKAMGGGWRANASTPGAFSVISSAPEPGRQDRWHVDLVTIAGHGSQFRLVSYVVCASL